jgi:hypothetical protein
VEGNVCDLIWSNIPAFTQKDWGKPQKNQVPVVSVLAEMWAQQLPNTSQNHQCLSQLAQFFTLSLVSYGVMDVLLSFIAAQELPKTAEYLYSA